MSERTDAPMCADYTEITELRATDPAAIDRAWQNRTTRPTMRGNGRLMIVAADHPARGALAVGSRPTAMNSRTDLLDRLRAAGGVICGDDHQPAVAAHGRPGGAVLPRPADRGRMSGAQFGDLGVVSAHRRISALRH